MRAAILVFLVLSIVGVARAQLEPLVPRAVPVKDYVWWEGERPVEHNFPKIGVFTPSTFPQRRGELSGGDWLSTAGKRGRATVIAIYHVVVPSDGEYALWCRKFWRHGPFQWRFRGSGGPENEWHTCGRDVALADDTPLRKHVNVNWVFLDRVKLKRGLRAFEIRLLAKEGEEIACGFDCFVLTKRMFVPNGKLKPDERRGEADEGYFAFEPPVDPFSDAALLDLRPLNEKVAGQAGPLKHDGNRVALGDGTPVRFWAVNVSAENAGRDRASIDYMARKLAKLGVNMVRYHSPMWTAGDPKKIAEVDPKRLDDLHYLVTALKREGIYTALSFYFPLWLRVEPGMGIDGYDDLGNKKPFAMVYFNPRLQELHRGWVTRILTAKNPHASDVPLAKDPALGLVELVNEDSFF